MIESVVYIYHNQKETAMFSQKVKELRIQKRLTLRMFCEKCGLDPSNWSKVERGVNPPPKDVEVLERISSVLGITGQDKLDFLDAAAMERGELPRDLLESPMLEKALPAFFRAARGHELSDEQLASLAKDLRALHTPDPE